MKKIAILGASYLQLPLVTKAKEKGHEVHCFAWDDGRAICKDIADYFYDISVLDTAKILEICKQVRVDGITTIATDICIPTIATIAKELHLIGNSEKCAKVTTNKGYMRKCFEENDILSPHFSIISAFNPVFFKDIKFPLIVKPSDRSGSLGVIKVNNTKDLENAVNYSLEVSFDKTCIVEQFITGREISVETISWQNHHHILAITDKIITDEPYFVELAHHQPSDLPLSIQQQIKEICFSILNATEVSNGASHIELKITPNNEIYVIEIGSRMGGDFIGSHLVTLSTGFDFVNAVIDISLHQFDGKVNITNNQFSGVYFLSKDTEQLLPYFENNDIADFRIIKKEIQNPELKHIKNSNDRSGYFIYHSNKRIDLL